MDLPTTAPSLLHRLAEQHPDQEAVVAGGARWSYRDLHDAAAHVAAGLRELGVVEGTRVGLLCTNRIEWLLTFFGATRCGATVVCINTWVGEWDLGHILAHARVEVLVTLADYGANSYVRALEALVPELATGAPRTWRADDYPHLREVVVIAGSRPSGARAWGELVTVGRATGPSAATPDQAAVVLYTSGSTARPKGVPLAHGDLVRNGHEIGERLGLGPRDRVWVAVPLFWSYGSANALMASLTHRSTLLLQESFDAGPSLELMVQEGATAGYFLPHLTRALLDHPAFDVTALSRLRRGLTIGVPEDLRLVAEELGVAGICNIYGSTETYGNCCVTPSTASLDRRAGSQGPPLPGMDVRVVGPSGEPLPAGTLGEIQVRGRVTPGYLGDEDLNRRAFTGDGYFRTGDLGHLDDEGWLVYHARRSEMIKTGGINVAPAEVEEFLLRHSTVTSVAVVGVPDPVRGEDVVAFVVGQDVDEQELRAHCRGQIASYKVPTRILQVSELPSTTTGKLDRRALVDIASQLGGAT